MSVSPTADSATEKKPAILRGCFRILLLYDVAEALDLEKILELLGPRGGLVKSAFPRRTPEYVRFEHVPVFEHCDPIRLDSGEGFPCAIQYYAFAVVAVQLEVAFECGWAELLVQASRWMDAPDLEPHSREMVRRHLERLAPAVVRPVADYLHEDYFIINVQNIQPVESGQPTAAELLRVHGDEIAQLVVGECTPLARTASEEILLGSLSFYPWDLVVMGSLAALVYDRGEEAGATMQILEYAKMQLLEFRYYDNLMSRLLSDVYTMLEAKRNLVLSRWNLPRDAQRINTIRLDVMDLTERIDNAIKFVSDAYYARVYRLAASRMGVADYRNLVEEKGRAVGELYDFMMDRFNEARSFVLELGIAILAIIDVVLLFKGH